MAHLCQIGKRRRRSLGTFSSRKEAERAERDALTARDRGIDLSPDRVTVAQLLARYLSDRSLRCGAKTNERYGQLVRQYILPRLGRITVAKLRPAHVSDWQTALQESGGHNGRPLSAKTVYHGRSLLFGALRWAVRMQLASRNVCEAVEIPKVARSSAKALSLDEVARLLTAAENTRWGPFTALAFALGARRGELCALKWVDVDLDAKTVTVRASLSQTKAGVTFKPTKTDRVRTVALSRFAIEAFRRQRATQAQERLRAGGAYEDRGLVFSDELGRVMTPMTATCAYERLARKANISSTRLHDARHTAATQLLVAGVDVRSVSGILGHGSATTTLATYAPLLADAQRDGIDRLGERLERRPSLKP